MPKDVNIYEQKSLPWMIIHRIVKPVALMAVASVRSQLKRGAKPSEVLNDTMVVDALGYMRDALTEIIAQKNRDGWVNPLAEFHYKAMSEIIRRDEVMRGGKDDHIRRMWMAVRDISSAVMDDDSHYMLRGYYYWDIFLENAEEVRKMMSGFPKEYWDWEQMKAQLVKEREKDEEYVRDFYGRTDTNYKPAGIPNRGVPAHVQDGGRHDTEEHGSAQPDKGSDTDVQAKAAEQRGLETSRLQPTRNQEASSQPGPARPSRTAPNPRR